jgi:peptidoglycan/LPS O-acetylase OafA/YrhL
VSYHTNLGIMSGGYVGVDVFFVISGFLITGQLARELEARRRVSLLGFYARRARRILPAASVVTVVTVLVGTAVLTPLAARRLYDDALTAIFFGVNFRLAAQGANYFNASLPPSALQHFWSLSVEEQFYVGWPLVLALSSLVWVRSRRRRAAAGGHDEAGTAERRAPDMTVVAVVLTAVVALSLLQSIHQTPRSPSWAYFSIVTRAWELGAGALAALAVPRAARLDPRVAAALTWFGLAAIAVAATQFGAGTAYPGVAALVPVVGAVAVVVGGSAAARRWNAEALLGTAPFQRVGSWSYSWYLWHWPALVLAAAAVGHALTVPEALAVAAGALCVSVLSYYFVERPTRRIQLVVRRPVLGLAGGGGLAVTSVMVVLLSGWTLPSLAPTGAPTLPALAPANAQAPAGAHAPASDQARRGATVATSAVLTPAQLSTDLVTGVKTTKAPSNLTPALGVAAQAVPLIVANGCHLQHAGTRSKPCIYGDTTSRTNVVLFGDSHAAAWFPALQVISGQRHWRLVDITKAGCPPVEVNILYTGTTPYPQCTAWRANAMAQIAALRPALVIADWARFLEEPEARPLAGVPTGFGTAWQNGVAAIFGFLHRSAAHVVFLSDTPTLIQLAPDCVSGHVSNVFPCTTARPGAVRLPLVKAQELALAKRFGVVAVDPGPWFCAPARCPVIVGNILLYRDNAHMVPAWSRFIAPVLADSIVPVVTG